MTCGFPVWWLVGDMWLPGQQEGPWEAGLICWASSVYPRAPQEQGPGATPNCVDFLTKLADFNCSDYQQREETLTPRVSRDF